MAYNRKWYEENREKQKAYVNARITRLNQWMQDYKSNLQCQRCGFSHPAALDFHHRDPESKDATLSQVARYKGWSKARILEEIAKCDILCSNCHRIEHWEQRRCRKMDITAIS